MSKRDDTCGWIFFLADERRTRVRVGFADNLPERVRDLKLASKEPLYLVAKLQGTRRDEAALHLRFRRWRLRSAWYSLAAPIVRFILLRIPEQLPVEGATVAALDLPELQTVEQISELLQIHPLTFRKLVVEKKIKHVRAGKQMRFSFADVLAALRAPEGGDPAPADPSGPGEHLRNRIGDCAPQERGESFPSASSSAPSTDAREAAKLAASAS